MFVLQAEHWRPTQASPPHAVVLCGAEPSAACPPAPCLPPASVVCPRSPPIHVSRSFQRGVSSAGFSCCTRAGRRRQRSSRHAAAAVRTCCTHAICSGGSGPSRLRCFLLCCCCRYRRRPSHSRAARSRPFRRSAGSAAEQPSFVHRGPGRPGAFVGAGARARAHGSGGAGIGRSCGAHEEATSHGGGVDSR